MKKHLVHIFCLLSMLLHVWIAQLHASEVMESSHTRVLIREHPKTGRPYVSIVPERPEISPDPFQNLRTRFTRPDYRMLDPKVKPGEIPYDGPYSSSTKVYLFAASLATLGTVGGAVGLAVLPASTGGAASGAGAYLTSGAAIAVGTAAGAQAAMRGNSKQDDFTQISKSQDTLTSSEESESNRLAARH